MKVNSIFLIVLQERVYECTSGTVFSSELQETKEIKEIALTDSIGYLITCITT